MRQTDVIRWGAPVPSFGDINHAVVATLGLNPSNREFVDDSGVELHGFCRRFHTLTSLGLRSWADADAYHLRLIVESCRAYFLANPYDLWFRKLDQILQGIGVSYYHPIATACHLDLIPYATSRKWTEMSFRERSSLLSLSGDSLPLLLKDSSVRLLILNGQTVVNQFEELAETRLERREMSGWTLNRRRKPDVKGFAYQGSVENLCGIRLSHRVLVLGFNHNIQSSFGVTREALVGIRRWIAKATKGLL